jgi:sec-independent protein translocase protein TatA
MSVGPWQIIIILVVILLLFGGNRLGEIGKGLGEGIRNFKKGIAGDDDPKQVPPAKKADVSVVDEKETKS